jgi:hypothetical protein
VVDDDDLEQREQVFQLMAGLLAPYIPDSGEWFKSAGQGYAQGEAIRNRNLRVDAGGQAAEGDMTGARSTLYEGGDFEGGNQITQMMRQASDDALKKTERFHSTLGNLALAADTPEKWTAAVSAAKSAGLDVSKYGDFSSRQMLLAQSGKTIEAINMEAERRKVEADQAIKRDAIQARLTQANQPKPPKPRNLSFNDTEKLAKQGVQLEGVKRYGETFKDEFSGYGRGGESMMAIARNLPILTGPTTESAATWWQDYDRYKNTVRNELFGSALTEAEQRAFESADITPNMDPKQIRANLARQKEATESALARKTRALTASGYNPEAIEGAVGVPLDELRVGGKDQGQLTKEAGAESKDVVPKVAKAQYDALPSGARYIAADDPDQQIRTKQ